MQPRGGRLGSPIQLTVENNDYNDAVIYAVWDWDGGRRYRVGTVTGKTSQTLEIPWRGSAVVFDVDFVGGQGYDVDPTEVDAGDHLSLMLVLRW